MATYATVAELATYLALSDQVTMPDDATAELVLQRAERDVDRMLGPGMVNATTGLRVTTASLTTVQKSALSRATCAAAEFRLQLGESELVGETEFAPDSLQVLRRAGRQAPKIGEELSGSGLVTFSGMATTAA